MIFSRLSMLKTPPLSSRRSPQRTSHSCRGWRLGGRALALCGLSMLLIAAVSAAEPIELTDQCPPSFDKTAAGRCLLVNLYQQYDSLQNRGIGGTRTSLPPHRDGFTPAQIDLGRYLFFDPVLSVNQSQSCASCHHPEMGFSDNRARSMGALGEQTPRSAPSLWNSAFLTRFFWDARATSLEGLVVEPLFGASEMANSPDQLLASLNALPGYRRLFAQAFPDRAQTDIRLHDIYTALAAFQASLISLNSRYDRYAHGYHQALNAQEIAGLNVFRSFVARCAECHTPPLFTNQQIAVIGTPEPEGQPRDIGAQQTFNAPKLRGGFKVPTLRNIASTAPYMHSGRFRSLREAVAFYTQGRGHAVPPGEDLQLHWHIWTPNLGDDEIDRLVDFLLTLSDETFKPAVPTRVPSGLTPVAHAGAAPSLAGQQAALAASNGEPQ